MIFGIALYSDIGIRSDREIGKVPSCVEKIMMVVSMLEQNTLVGDTLL